MSIEERLAALERRSDLHYHYLPNGERTTAPGMAAHDNAKPQPEPLPAMKRPEPKPLTRFSSEREVLEHPDTQLAIGKIMLERDKADPYAEMKAAHAAGKVIEFLSSSTYQWEPIEKPCWDIYVSYRIKPDADPKDKPAPTPGKLDISFPPRGKYDVGGQSADETKDKPAPSGYGVVGCTAVDVTAPSGVDAVKLAKRIYDLLCEHAHGDYDSSAVMLANAIRSGKVPGIYCGESNNVVQTALNIAAQRDALRAELEAVKDQRRIETGMREKMVEAAIAYKNRADAAEAKLAEAEMERIDVVDRLTREAYDLVYAGEPDDEREVRWKWVTLGIAELRKQANALKEFHACWYEDGDEYLSTHHADDPPYVVAKWIKARDAMGNGG